MRRSSPLVGLFWFVLGAVSAARNGSRRQDYVDLKPREGYVYLVKAEGQKGLYKIGRTKNPDDRMRTFQLNLPYVVTYTHVIPCRDMYVAERALHEEYAHKRLRNPETGTLTEWFRLTSRDVRRIKSIRRL